MRHVKSMKIGGLLLFVGMVAVEGGRLAPRASGEPAAETQRQVAQARFAPAEPTVNKDDPMAEGQAILLAVDSLQSTLNEQHTLIAETEKSLKSLRARSLEIEKRVKLLADQLQEIKSRRRKTK